MNEQKYKAKLRFPQEQYAFIEIDFEGEISEIKELYREFSTTNELKDKEFNAFIDAYLVGNPVSSEDYMACSDKQKEIVQVIKRSLKRIKGRNQLTETDLDEIN